MVQITKSVGDQGDNKQDDAAIIQAMLVLAKNAAGKSYLSSYDGIVGKMTKEAILSFQLDQKLIEKNVAAANPAAKGKAPDYKSLVAGATPGLVKPNDPTVAKLLSLIPAEFNDIRTLPGGKTVYLPTDKAAMSASQNAINGNDGFVAAFRDKVALLVETIWNSTKVAPAIAGKDGGRRDFQAQYQLTLKQGVTNAGPGESNHNYGQAVDLGFEKLRWLRPNGVVVENEDPWMHQLDPNQTAAGEAGRFWNLMRDIGTSAAVGLNRGPANDHPHLQTWDDAKVDMADRLAALLTQVGAAKWKGLNQHYRTDFGLGGNYYSVGKAVFIWTEAALVLPSDLAAAFTAKAKAAAVKAGPQSIEWKTFKPITAAQIDAKQIKAVQKALKVDFEKADQAWKQWTPY